MAMRLMLLFCATLASLFLLSTDAFITKVPGKSQSCFYEYVRTKRTAFLKVQVVEAKDRYDIRLKAYGPFRDHPSEDDQSMSFFNEVVETPQEGQTANMQHNGFNFDTEHRGGYYKFCLDNSHASHEKSVEFFTSFDLTAKDDLGHEDEMEAYIKKEHMEGAKKSLKHLKELLGQVQSEQGYYRSRTYRHQQTLESNASRVVWYTLLEILTLGILYGAQSFLLHKWFQDRGFLTKRQWA